MFYLLVQRAAGDYKEMMASCIAAIVALYHIFRSISGLAQLRAYSIWCAKALRCLDQLNSADKVSRNSLREHKDWLYQRMPKFAHTHDSLPCLHTNCQISSSPAASSFIPLNSTENSTSSAPVRSSDSAEITSEHHASLGMRDSVAIPVGPVRRAGINAEDIAKRIDTQMLVNNQVIDNELFGSELPVRLCLPECGMKRALRNALHLQFDDWLCSRDIVRCTLRWTIAVLSNFGRHWVHCNKPDSFPEPDVDLLLPYQMTVPVDFHFVIRACQTTLATDALFYNAGALDDMDIYLKNNVSEINLSKERMVSLRNLNTKQVLHFLALMAANEGTHPIPSHPSSSSELFAEGLHSTDGVSNVHSSPVLDEPYHAVEIDSTQTPPSQPDSNRKPSLRKIPESVSDPSSLRSSARPLRHVRFNDSEQPDMHKTEKSTNAPAANERTNEAQNAQDSPEGRNPSQGRGPQVPQNDS